MLRDNLIELHQASEVDIVKQVGHRLMNGMYDLSWYPAHLRARYCQF